MNLVFSALLLLTGAHIWALGWSLGTLLSIIGRGVFLLRLLGSVPSIKISIGFEAGNLFLVGLSVIFTAGSVSLVSSLLTLASCALATLLYLIDEALYLYVVRDEDAEED